MKSDVPKVLHKVNNVPMIVRIILEAKKLNPEKIIIVVGEYLKIIKAEINNYDVGNIEFALQEVPLGTGDAIKSTLYFFKDDMNINNIILNGDTPLLKYETIQYLYDNFIDNKNKLQITCIKLDNPHGNGRIVLNSKNEFQKIVEEKDCNEEERNIKLVNVGIYIASSEILLKYIPKIKNKNAQKEFYLTDIVELYKYGEKDLVGLCKLNENKIDEIYNVNTKEQLDFINKSYFNL